MPNKIPRSPFTTRLSGSAKETELRLRNIFQWKKKRPPIPLFLLTVAAVMSCFGLVSCESRAEEPADESPKASEQTPLELNADEVLTLTTADGRILTVGLYLTAAEQDEDWFAVTRVEVQEEDTLIQTIDPAQLPANDSYLFEGLFVVPGYNMGSPDVRDLNFDGSEDLGLLATNHFPHNIPYRYFLWDEEQGQLVDSFMMCNLPDLDTDKQQLIEKWTDGVTRYYKVENNYPVMLKETQWEGEESETYIYEDKLTGLTLDDNGTGDDYVTITARLPTNDSVKNEITMYVVLGGDQGVLTHTWETRARPKLLSGRISSVQKDSIVVELQNTTSNYGAADVFIAEVQNGELTLFEYNEPMNENNVVYGSQVVPRTDSELSCVRIPTLASKWHSPEWNTLIWENGQWKNVPDGYFTDTYTLTVDGGMELTLALRGWHSDESSWYYDQIQILHGETVLQTIPEGSFTPDTHCPFEYFNADTAYHKVLAYDINFDGNTDFGIPCNTTHNDGHVWFLYDPQTRQYRFAFSLAGEPTVEEEKQQIIEEWWDDSIYITYNTYEYSDQGTLTLVDSYIDN